MGRIDLPNSDSEKNLPTPSSKVIGGGGLVDSYGKPLEDCDAGIIVPKREIVIPKKVKQALENKKRLASEIENGKVNPRENNNNFGEIYDKKAQSLLKEVPANSVDYQNFKYFLEKFSVDNHESIQHEKDREENFTVNETSLKKFGLPKKVIHELLDFMFCSLAQQKPIEQEVNVDFRRRFLLLRQIYHSFTYINEFPYQEYKEDVLSGLFTGNIDQRILFENIISNFYLDELSIGEGRKIVHYLFQQKELSSDLAQAIFNRFEGLRQEFSQAKDQSLIKPENLRNVPIEELISDKETWYKLALNEADPYREIPNTKLGLELEFKLQGTDQRAHEYINKFIETYQDILFSNGGEILWQDQGVAEIAVGGQNGLAMSRDLLLKIDGLITELEKSPEFVAWGSTHIHVDSYRGMDIDNSLFHFNDYNWDGKGFETKEVPLASPGSVNRYSYILESQTVADQMRIIALLYQQGSEGVTSSQASDYFLNLGSKGKNEVVEGLLLNSAKDYAPEAVPSILRLGAKNRLPYLNEVALAEKINTLPGTTEVIAAIAQVNWMAQKILAEKINTLPGTAEVITTITQTDREAQKILAEKIESILDEDGVREKMTLLDSDAQEIIRSKLD